MLISEALKETGKATNKYNDCNGKTGYVDWYKGELFWFDKASGDRRHILTHKEIFDDDYQPYHPIEEIVPKEVGELWLNKLGGSFIIHHNQYESPDGVSVTYAIGKKEGLPKNIFHGKDGWERIEPPAPDKNVEEVVINGVEFREHKGFSIPFTSGKVSGNELFDKYLDKPSVTMKLLIPKET